jgi:hypothetical protein
MVFRLAGDGGTGVGFEGGDLALTDGVSIVAFGDPLGDPAAGLAACVAPDFGDPAADVWGVGLNPAFFDRQRGVEVAVDATGRELRGGTGDRAFVVYDVTYYPTGGATAGEAARQPSVAVYDAADDPTDGEVTGSDPTGEPSAAVYATETDHSDGGATETRLAGQPYRLYLECREMAGGAWVLGIAQLTPTAAYDAAVAAREALLATIDG